MEQEQVWQSIERERLAFADLLEGLTPDQWEVESLCSGWRVRGSRPTPTGHLPDQPAQAPATWRVAALSRFHRLTLATESVMVASSSSV